MDYSCISPIEFEQLASDILSHILKKETRTYKEGPDGGIDLELRDGHSFIMGQVKRYSKSAYSVLISDLKKEVEKVKKQKPDSYYVFTSMELNEGQISAIFQMFWPFMKSTDCVFDGHQIDCFLRKEETAYIRRKNIKLWIDSFNTLKEVFKPDLSKDVDELMNSIDKHKKIYVQTSFYYEAMKTLYKKRVLLVAGKAGSGKSTLCEMILLGFKADNPSARVVYSQITDYKDLMRNLDDDSTNPEIVYVDDFLGQSCLEIASSSLSSIKMLLSYVERHSNKYLIINSRIQVLNEVQNDNNEIYERLKKAGFIDLGSKELSDMEKANILYSHIVSSDIGIKRISMLVQNGYYYSIINHKNYLPRIVQYLFNENQYPENEEEYLTYVEDTLNHPEKVWENEYNKRIFPEDRMLLEILYSVSDYRVERDSLRKAFNRQKGGANYPQVDSSKAFLFENAIKRLNGGFIFLSTNGNRTTVQVSNPSINDFLKTVFSNKSPGLIKDMLDNSVCFEQLYRLGGGRYFDDALLEKKHKEGFTYSAVIFNKYFYFETILYIASLRIDNSQRFLGLIANALDYLTSFETDYVECIISYPLGYILFDFVNEETFDYYPFLLEDSFFDKIVNLIRNKCSYDVVLKIYNNCPNLDEDKSDLLVEIALDDAVMDAYDDVDVGNFIDNFSVSDYCDYDDIDGQPVVNFTKMAEKLKEEIVDFIYGNIQSFERLREIDCIKPIDFFDIEKIIDDYCDFEDLVEEHFKDDDDDRDDYAYTSNEKESNAKIDRMFKGLLD